MRNSLIALAGAPTLSPALELALSAPRRLVPRIVPVCGTARAHRRLAPQIVPVRGDARAPRRLAPRIVVPRSSRRRTPRVVPACDG
jgi:hypothetical protein